MPKTTRFSPTLERRRTYSYNGRSRLGSRDSIGSSAATASVMGIASESYMRIKKKGALTWSTRYLVMRSSQLVWFNSKQDADTRRGVVDAMTVAVGSITTLRHEIGLAISTMDGKEFVARTFNRGDLARWITAFQRLDIKREAKRASLRMAERASEALTTLTDESDTSDVMDAPTVSGNKLPASPKKERRRQVSFHANVLVRVIPPVTEDLIPELYYSKKDMEKFSAQASSLFSRTEDVMSCAYLAFRRSSSSSASSVSCRKEVA